MNLLDNTENRILQRIGPDRTVRFYGDDGKEVGCFDFGKSPATFTGDVDISARLFVDAALKQFEIIKRL